MNLIRLGLWRDFKHLARATASDKVLRDKVFNIVKNPKYDGYQGGLASMVYNFFNKKSKGSSINDKISQNQHPIDLATHQLAKKLHRLLKNFKK